MADDGIDGNSQPEQFTPIPDQLVALGKPVTFTTTVTGLDANEPATGWIDWGQGKQQIQAVNNGGTVTLTATYPSMPAGGLSGTFTVNEHDGDAFSSQQFSASPYSVALAVGDATNPAPPDTVQDTPFIPIDDGYDSDTQSVPNNQLTAPDPSDPELVPATVTMNGPSGTWAAWSLTFPSNVRVFETQVNGSLSPLSSGQQSDPMQFDSTGVITSPTLLVQGFGPDAGAAAITGTMTPATDPNTGAPPASTQPANATVGTNVGPNSLAVLSVKDNAAGAALTAAQQQKSGTIYVPVSNPTEGLVYKLPLVIHNLTVSAELLGVPAGMTILDSNGNPLQATKATNGPIKLPNNPPAQTGILFSPSPGQDIDLYVELTKTTAPVTLVLAQVNKNHQTGTSDGTTYPTLGTAVITPFVLSRLAGKANLTTGAGPTDVPQYGTYTYTETVAGGQWLDPTAGDPVAGGNNPNVMQIKWHAGPTSGAAIYQADAQYVWDMPVNIFKIAVSTPTTPGHNAAASGGTPYGSSVGKFASVTVTNLLMNAAFTITGPNGNQGLGHMSVGFIQNGSPVTTQATYSTNAQDQKTYATFSLASSTFGSKILDGNTFWDTQGYISAAPTDPIYDLYNPKVVKTGLAAGLISTEDKPQVVFPQSWRTFGPILKDTVDWQMTMYVVGFTGEAPASFAPQAYLPWTFNGSSTFPNNKWQSNGGGVTYRTTNGQPAWIAMDGTQPAGEKPFTTDPPQFNSLIQADTSLPPAKQIPPVFLK